MALVGGRLGVYTSLHGNGCLYKNGWKTVIKHPYLWLNDTSVLRLANFILAERGFSMMIGLTIGTELGSGIFINEIMPGRKWRDREFGILNLDHS